MMRVDRELEGSTNLFIVNTPLQLLTAYIIANSFCGGMNNQLLFISRNWQDLYKESFYIKEILEDNTVWTRVSKIQNWLGRTSCISGLKQEMADMRDWLFSNTAKFDQVFLGSDKSISNQIIVELSGNTHYNRLEDGVWSYYCVDRHLLSKLWCKVKVKFIRDCGNLYSDMKYNVRGVGHGRSALADYLYKPELLTRYSPRAVKIKSSQISAAMEKLSQHPALYQNYLFDKSVLFLGSMLVERKKISIEEEFGLLQSIYKMCNLHNIRLLYKPHPSESDRKIAVYRQKLPDLDICMIRDPIEILFNKINGLQYVLAHSSSGLIFADVFSGGRVKAIALHHLYNRKSDDTLVNHLMESASVMIPKTMEELQNYLTVVRQFDSEED